MAQANIITSQTAAANSADITVTTTPVVIRMYTDETSGLIAGDFHASIYYKHSGSTTYYALTRNAFNNQTYTVVLSNPGVYQVRKPVTTKKVGFFTE
jgi:hypothetical protein